LSLDAETRVEIDQEENSKGRGEAVVQPRRKGLGPLLLPALIGRPPDKKQRARMLYLRD